MDDATLATVRFGVPGWRFTPSGRTIRVELVAPPDDNRHSPPAPLPWFGDDAFIAEPLGLGATVERVFCTLQYLRDHWLREEFTVNGVRWFETHDPPVTGYQKDWWVERQSALRGY